MRLMLCLTGLIALQLAPHSPLSSFEGLLDADRTFAARAAGVPGIVSIPAMFAADVTVPAPGNVFVTGKARAIEALQANTDNLTAEARWAPEGGSISADGLHGFTYGFMTLKRADGSVVPLKYLAYWVRGTDGWRVAAYRRRPRPEGPVRAGAVSPALPPSMVRPTTDPEVLGAHASGLAAAEQAFSDEAQAIGLGAAFARHGRADAINMGGPADPGFVFGAEAIGRSVGAGEPVDRSPVAWNAERVLVASSGDLGITFGTIRWHQPAPGAPASVPFFTIWRRDGPALPWRYAAE